MNTSYDTSFYLYHASGDQQRATMLFSTLSVENKMGILSDLLSMRTGLSQHKKVWEHFLNQELPPIEQKSFHRVVEAVLTLEEPLLTKTLFQSIWGQHHMPSYAQSSHFLTCLWKIYERKNGIGTSFKAFLNDQPKSEHINHVLGALFCVNSEDKALSYFHLLPNTSPSPLVWCFNYQKESKLLDVFTELGSFLQYRGLLQCLEMGKENEFLKLFPYYTNSSTKELTTLCQEALVRKLYHASDILLPFADMNELGVLVIRSIEQHDEQMMRRLAPFVGDVEGIGKMIKMRSRHKERVPSGWQVFQNLVTKEHLTEALEHTSAKGSSSHRKM